MQTFKGGIHPFEGKEITKDKPIVVINDLPKEMVYPLAQHLGVPAKPLVNVGDEVKVGQIIGEAAGFISADIVSTVSGKVKAIENRLDIGGNMTLSVIVENDNLDTKVDGFGEDRDWEKLSNEEIVTIVKNAGIVGLGGASFPTHVKLSPEDPNKIDYVLANGAECEPYLTSDYRLMMEKGEEIIKGLKVFQKLFPNAKCLICIEDNKPEAIKNLKELCKNEDKIEVCELKTKYPQGGERQLIYAATGRKINSTTLPAKAGCLVDNVDTIIAVYNAVCKQIPLLRRIMTLSGYCFNEPGNYEARFGMTYQTLIEKAGGFKTQAKKLISGGPMMGLCIFDVNVPVAKNSSAVISLDKDDVEEKGTNCINCGRCIEACPENLVPALLAHETINFNCENFAKLYGMECIECGSCAYVCPAKRPLTQMFKIMKRKTGAYLREKANKEKAKQEKMAKEKGGKE